MVEKKQKGINMPFCLIHFDEFMRGKKSRSVAEFLFAVLLGILLLIFLYMVFNKYF